MPLPSEISCETLEALRNFKADMCYELRRNVAYTRLIENFFSCLFPRNVWSPDNQYEDAHTMNIEVHKKPDETMYLFVNMSLNFENPREPHIMWFYKIEDKTVTEIDIHTFNRGKRGSDVKSISIYHKQTLHESLLEEYNERHGTSYTRIDPPPRVKFVVD